MSKKHSEEYEEIRKQTIERSGGKSTFVILNKMRMYCAHPLLLSDLFYEDRAENSLKYNRLLEIVEEIFTNNKK